MKPPWEWTEEDLEELIRSATQESVELDYKQCDALAKTDAKRDEISKDVSAFANSAGGTLLYGMKEDKRIPTAIDVGFDPADISKEWLEQVINSKIHRRIDGIRIKPVELGGERQGRVAYVVYVPQSMRAPHQAADKRFYKRFNFESRPMEEYEVRDVARRAETPQLFVKFTFRNEATQNRVNQDAGRSVPPICVLVGNHAAAPASNAMISIYLDEMLAVNRIDLKKARSGTMPVRCGSNTYMAKRFLMPWHAAQKMPIWEGLLQIVTEMQVEVSVEVRQLTRDYLLAWEVQAPGMSTQAGSAVLRYFRGSLHIVTDPTPPEFIHDEAE